MKTLFITKCKRNERSESRGTFKSYYTFAVTQDLLQKSHINRNLSWRFFVLDDIYFRSFYLFYLTIFLLIFLQILTRSFFVLLGDVTLSWLRTHMLRNDGLSKTEGKWLRTCIDFMTRGSFYIDHFNLISSLDQNFSAGLYLIVLFNDTFIFFMFYLWLGTWSTSCSLDLYVWNRERYEILHFCIPKFKIKNVKSKWRWKESETDANAVSTRLHWEICSKTRTQQTFIGSVDVSTCENYWIHTFH